MATVLAADFMESVPVSYFLCMEVEVGLCVLESLRLRSMA